MFLYYSFNRNGIKVFLVYINAVYQKYTLTIFQKQQK